MVQLTGSSVRRLSRPVVLVVLLSMATSTLASPDISIIDGDNVVSATGNSAAPPATAPAQPGETPACANFNYQHPGSLQAVLDYTTAATSSNTATANGCWSAYKRYCNYNLASAEDVAARQNWTDNMNTIHTLLSQATAPILLAPDCTDVLKHQDQTNNLLGLLHQTSAPAGKYIAGTDSATPASLDWRSNGYIGPVTAQAGGTCFAHASANYMTFYVIANGIPDVTGKNYMDDTTNISPQPLVDCYASTDICTTGGWPTNMINFFRDRPQTTINVFPYASTDPNPNGVTAAFAGCKQANNPLCPKLTGTSQFSYLMPANTQADSYSMSESQLVYAIANYGPVVVTLAVHPNFSKWRYNPTVGSVSYPGPGEVNTLSANPAKDTDWCNPQINHAVLAVGYVLDGDNSYLIIKNSWGVSYGQDGYWHITLSNPSSAKFSDPNFGGTCGIATGVTIVSVNSPPSPANTAGGAAVGATSTGALLAAPRNATRLAPAPAPALAARRAGPPIPAPAPATRPVTTSSISG